jgi:hemolysin III
LLEAPLPRRKLAYSDLKEPFCAVSHYTGAALSLIALIALLVAAHGRLWQTLGGAVFGLSLITLYMASALSHTWNTTPRIQDRLSRFDYIAIFLLIAGTYAPICLVTLRGPLGWKVLGLEYGLALFGIANIVFWTKTPHWMRVPVYVIMGWLITLLWGSLEHVLPQIARDWMIAGGLFYTIGLVILAVDKPHLWPGKFSAHDLWHLFVIAGSFCHFVLVLRYIVAP